MGARPKPEPQTERGQHAERELARLVAHGLPLEEPSSQLRVGGGR